MAPGIPWRNIENLSRLLRHDADPELVLTFTQEQLPGLVTAAQDLAAKFSKTASVSSADSGVV